MNNRLELLVKGKQHGALVVVQLVESEIELPGFVECWVEPVRVADAECIDVRLVELLHLVEL
jgi:hypothetical protein